MMSLGLGNCKLALSIRLNVCLLLRKPEGTECVGVYAGKRFAWEEALIALIRIYQR